MTVKTDDGYIINSQYGEFNKNSGILILKDNIKGKDNKNNIIETEFAQYNEKSKIFKTIGSTKIYTSERYVIEGSNIFFDNNQKIINSEERALIIDQDNNQISLEKFNYDINNDIFKSVGDVKIQDVNENTYEFSQIYIDTKKKEILGTIQSYLLIKMTSKLMIEINHEYFQILLRLVKMKVFLKKVFLHYVIIDLMTNVLHGLYSLVKCSTITKKRQFFIKTL